MQRDRARSFIKTTFLRFSSVKDRETVLVSICETSPRVSAESKLVEEVARVSVGV